MDVKSENKKPFVVSVEGNIGSGKSTMLNYFKKFHDVELHPEPVQKWCDLNGSNLLEKLYEDPKRWSFQFQSYIQLTRLQILKEPSTTPVKIIERSLQNNRFCFLELGKQTGSLSSTELDVLTSWYDWLDSHMSLELDLIVYLRTDPSVAHHRLQTRGRKEEAGVPIEYLRHLHDAYEGWLLHERFGRVPAPVIIIDANQDLHKLFEIYSKHSDEIRGKKVVEMGQFQID